MIHIWLKHTGEPIVLTGGKEDGVAVGMRKEQVEVFYYR